MATYSGDCGFRTERDGRRHTLHRTGGRGLHYATVSAGSAASTHWHLSGEEADARPRGHAPAADRRRAQQVQRAVACDSARSGGGGVAEPAPSSHSVTTRWPFFSPILCTFLITANGIPRNR